MSKEFSTTYTYLYEQKETYKWLLFTFSNCWVGQIIMVHLKDMDMLEWNSIVMVRYPGNPVDTLKSRIPDHNNGPKTVQRSSSPAIHLITLLLNYSHILL